MPASSWGGSAQRYEQMYIDAAKELGIDELLSPIVPLIANERVLDLGCATGWQARALVERGCTVVGVEMDRSAAALATAWCERVIVCDLDLADLVGLVGDDRFDVVAAGDVLEHLRDPVRVLQFIPQLLRPGGRVVASIPNVAHGSVRLALLTGSFAYEEAGLLDRTHLRFFTLSTVEEMFASAGYSVEQLERTVVPIDKGIPYDPSLLPPGIEDAVSAMPEATTFQFVVVARPVDEVTRTVPDVDHADIGGVQDALLLEQAAALRARDETLRALRRTVSDLERQIEQHQKSKLRPRWRRGLDAFLRRIRRVG